MLVKYFSTKETVTFVYIDSPYLFCRVRGIPAAIVSCDKYCHKKESIVCESKDYVLLDLQLDRYQAKAILDQICMLEDQNLLEEVMMIYEEAGKLNGN